MNWEGQPPLGEQDVAGVLASLERWVPEPVREIRLISDHSNELAEVGFPSGRRLVLKRARYSQLGGRLVAANEAARLLWDQAGVLAPEGLVMRDTQGDPVLVYWWIDYPTLEELWPRLEAPERSEALREWGRLMRRMHRVRVPGHGPLTPPANEGVSLRHFLRTDLECRLLPAAYAHWPEGAATVAALLRAVERVGERGRDRCVFLHGDLFSANVLAEATLGRIRCVGVLDLEDAFGGPPEADLARTEILHGPLFGRSLPGCWFEDLAQGYGEELDPFLLGFFRSYQLLNMGYHAAMTGHGMHAAAVANAAQCELDALGTGLRHADLVGADGPGCRTVEPAGAGANASAAEV